MSGVSRAFEEWWADEWGVDSMIGAEVEKEDFAGAFAAGWEAAMNAEWVTSSVPMLGIEGGEHHSWLHPGHPA